MGESGKESYTKGFFKREPEDNLESKVNLVIETMERLADRLQRIEAKVDLLATKKIPVKNGSVKAMAESSTSEDESSSSDEEPATSAKAAAKDSSSSEDEKAEDEKPDHKKAKAYTNTLLKRGALVIKSRKETPKKKVRAEFTRSFASSHNRLEVRDETIKRAAYTPQISGIGGDDQTIIVKGFDSSLPKDDIKSALSKYFSSCGEITRVVVPTDLETGAVIGCAYIQLKEGVEKALKLSGSYLGGWNLVVEKVSRISDVGGRFGPSGRGGRWPFPYRCNGLGYCTTC